MAGDATTGLLASSNPYLAGASMFSDAMQGGPSSNASGSSTSSFDASGWNVNFGSGSIESKRSSGQPVSARAESVELEQYVPYMLGLFGLLVVFRLTRKKG